MVDRFSRLPDDLLIRILSFLPIKKAVATSILSKRWLPLWTFLSRLNFVEAYNPPVGCNLSSDFVFKTLLSNKSPVIESLHLTRLSRWSFVQMELWVGFAVDRFVRHLKIACQLSASHRYCFIRLPPKLFRCETLETLELDTVFLFNVPSRVSFGSLKKLKLVSVMYANEESFVRLISSSPVLGDLFVELCEEDNIETVTTNVPSLQNLAVHKDDRYYRLFVIHSHSLKELDIQNEYGEVNLIGDMRELVKANLVTTGSKGKGNVLKSLTFVKILSLSLDCEARQYHIGTIFSQLVCLEFRANCWDWCKLLVNVLQHSPRLQILKLEDDCEIGWKDEEDVDNNCLVQPSCAPEFLYHLKTFEWRDYVGSPLQKEVANYILKNATRLVTATFCEGPFRVRNQAFEELEFATRDSRACELTIFSTDE